MDAVTPQQATTADQHSHIVRPAEMEWQKTRFPGCEAKTLLFDREGASYGEASPVRPLSPPPARIAKRGRGKMLDARELKSLGAKALCWFDSGRPHQLIDIEICIAPPHSAPASNIGDATPRASRTEMKRAADLTKRVSRTGVLVAANVVDSASLDN
jgi:hypothetical protein